MILLQINTTANWGSTGKIAEQIGERILDRGGKSYLAYGYYVNPSRSVLLRLGSKLSLKWHRRIARWFDRHGLLSRCATRKLIKQIRQIKPDIIHLHNIHGDFINYPILFEYLQSVDTPVVWTLHDCWTFTGRCAHYIKSGCDKWKSGCYDCKHKKSYPKTYIDRSAQNYALKRKYFTSLGDRLVIVPVSEWLAEEARQSFFANSRIHRIYNGIDIATFVPCRESEIRSQLGIDPKQRIVLGVASAWSADKGIFDFYKLREQLDQSYTIVLVGLNEKTIAELPEGIVGIPRTNSVAELAELYSEANVFVNPTYADTFPTTNLEAMACGTPVITYRTGGSPEPITPYTGIVVERAGDVKGLRDAIVDICDKGKARYAEECRKRVVENFDKRTCFDKYIELYDEILTNKNR